MDLQISVFLLFILFTGGHCLSCYECDSMTGSCADQKVITCGSGFQCISSTKVRRFCDKITTVKVKGCALSNDCTTSSLNFGTGKESSSCCDTDLCNSQDPLESSFNGQKCYYCDEQSCSNIVNCSGSEDRCFQATRSFGCHSMFVKGCVSKAICIATTADPIAPHVSCCERDLCNYLDSVAQRTTQSYLFLCCSLLAFILLH